MAKIFKKNGNKSLRELESMLDLGLQDLYALFYVDHNTKIRETRIMKKMKP